jgi:transcriptional regulator with XRE-family HTH domain
VNTSSNFAKRLNEWRSLVNISQEEAARQLNVGRSWLNQLERGKRKPGPKLIAKLEELIALGSSEVNIKQQVNTAGSLSQESSLPENLPRDNGDSDLVVKRVRLATKLRAEARELRECAEKFSLMAERIETEAESLERSCETDLTKLRLP